jgi:hypothetical protein
MSGFTLLLPMLLTFGPVTEAGKPQATAAGTKIARLVVRDSVSRAGDPITLEAVLEIRAEVDRQGKAVAQNCLATVSNGRTARQTSWPVLFHPFVIVRYHEEVTWKGTAKEPKVNPSPGELWEGGKPRKIACLQAKGEYELTVTRITRWEVRDCSGPLWLGSPRVQVHEQVLVLYLILGLADDLCYTNITTLFNCPEPPGWQEVAAEPRTLQGPIDWYSHWELTTRRLPRQPKP